MKQKAQQQRWKQRFENLEKALHFLEEACNKQDLSTLEAGGLIQAFEFTFELSWKTLKDYLLSQGIAVQFPREAIKQAFANELILDGHLWLEMLEKRSLLSHHYEEQQALESVTIIRNHYLSGLQQVYQTLKKKL